MFWKYLDELGLALDGKNNLDVAGLLQGFRRVFGINAKEPIL